VIVTPYVSVDGIVEIIDNYGNCKGIVLIERLNKPVGLALPGGFVDVGERVESALIREMKEEICLDVSIQSLLGIYSDPSRDERFHTVSIVYVCKASGEPVGADDAKSAYLCPLDEIPFDQLVFDHAQILRDYLNQRKA